jgi:hypothetical protein
MGKVIGFEQIERRRKIVLVRSEIEARRAENLERLSELKRSFPAVLAGVALGETEQNEAARVRDQLRQTLDDNATMELILRGLSSWESGLQHQLSATTTASKGE